jgi:hypothetical protein
MTWNLTSATVELHGYLNVRDSFVQTIHHN